MNEDSNSNAKDAIDEGVGWGMMTLKSFVPLACHFSQSTSTTKDTSPTKIVDVQPPVPVAINPPANTTINNEWLHFCIMVLLEGKHGKMSNRMCTYLVHILCISYAFVLILCISLCFYMIYRHQTS